ncbi:microtubule-associated serine/threonine-protein kinase 2-like [Sebastes fasciatus]|uniref:microtubule-associated serine/threonine-protein kinase 2-like n=1 Tax=Sebastes fasciatus TaxID=394691 RepID=UPI003D9E71E4
MELEPVQMDQQTEFPVEVLPQATRARKFIQLQLMELSKDCGNTLQNGQVSPNCFVELQTKLEKILHQTRAACKPPPTKPAKRDFKVIKQVARGAFGTVELVRHKKTKKTFAMKLITLQYPNQRDAVLLERDILTYLDHPLIVPMFCSFETESHMYMAMEYVGGGDLADLLQDKRRFRMDLARFYMAELVLAVEYIHSYGILHRDLKPSNLLISTDGHIKVADFGLSKIGSVSTAACLTESERRRNAREFTDLETCGTSVFMAPELFLKTGYGKPIDWWATGIILYNFLYGNVPFSGWNSKETAELVTENDIHFPDAGSPQRDVARNLISRLLEKDPVKRLGTRGASEVKRQPFFRGVDWKNLPYETPPYVPNAEDTSRFPMCASSDSDDDQTVSPAEQTDFCTVAFRFNKVYGSPMPLSPCTPMNRVLLSEKPGHSEPKEGQQEIEAFDEGFCDSTPSPPPHHASPGQIGPKYFDSDSDGEDEDVSNMHFGEASQRQSGWDESQSDSTPSPPPHHASPGQMDSVYFNGDPDGEDEDVSNMHFIEASHRQSGRDESQCDSTPSPAPNHVSPGQIVSKYFDSDSDEEDVSNMHFIEASHRQSGRNESQCDSTPSPPPHHASPVQMDPVEECPSNDLLEATWSLMSIMLQLVELAKDCGNTLQNDLVSPNFFVELESKVVKIHQETHKACSPTVEDDSSEDSADPTVEDNCCKEDREPNGRDRWPPTQSPVLLKVSTR